MKKGQYWKDFCDLVTFKFQLFFLQARLLSSKSEAIEAFRATQTLKYENGTKVTPLFSAQEYDRRLSTLRAKMEERNLQVIFYNE